MRPEPRAAGSGADATDRAWATFTGHDQTVCSGTGSIGSLRNALVDLGITRPFLVTGQSLAASDIVDRVRANAGAAFVGTFAQATAHAPIDAAARCAAAFDDSDGDGLVALGGGSPLEIARCVATLDRAAIERGVVRDDEPDPVVAISTTLSQAEFTKTFGFRTPAGLKEVRIHPGLGPQHVILDADLAMSTPTRLWISSGVKAVDTALAVLCRVTDMSDTVLEGIADLVRLLPASHRDPDDIELRQALQMAAWRGTFPIRNGGIATHTVPAWTWLGSAARHQLGGTSGAPHGELACALLPIVVDFHRDDLAPHAGALSDIFQARHPDLPTAVDAWLRELGMPTRLREIGVDAAHVAAAVPQIALESPRLAGRRADIAARLTSLL